MFPIKYMEENLVLNNDGECFAYYELIPYNYSFLSLAERAEIRSLFKRMVMQNRDGKIHFLEISSESSIKAVQERSKKNIKGILRDIAIKEVDEQSKALAELVGETQVDYRFFMGFKLFVNEGEIDLKEVLKIIKTACIDFVLDVRNKIMSDFYGISNDEIKRFLNMEKLLEGRISKDFRVRAVNKDDLGYIVEHLHGGQGVLYEDYSYHLPVIKDMKANKVWVKKYDLLKLSRREIKEHQRYVRITDDDGNETFVAYFVLQDIIDEMDDFSSEVFYEQQRRLDFPVDTSINVEVIENRKAKAILDNKQLELKDMDEHAAQAGAKLNSEIVSAMENADELDEHLDTSKEPLFKVSYLVRVAAKELSELRLRCSLVKDYYESLNMKIIRPLGDQVGLHNEFIPTAKRYKNDYLQYVKSDFLATLCFGAARIVGEGKGIYIGNISNTETNVYINPALPAQGVRGSVTNSLSVSFTGSLGGGKSVAANLFTYKSVLWGAKAIILDPKSERGKWKEKLPDIAEYMNIINITSAKENKGMLDPYFVMGNRKDADALMVEVLTYLTGITIQDAVRFPTLRRAIRAVTKSENPYSLKVIEMLREEDTEVSRAIAEHLESFVDYDFAILLFGDGTRVDNEVFNNRLNIIQIADLVMPDKGKDSKDYTAIEMLSTAMMLVQCTHFLDFIKSDRETFKLIVIEESWVLLGIAQGKALIKKLNRAGRAMNTAIFLIYQNADDIDDDMKSNIGMKLAFRAGDMVEAKKILKYFGLDAEDVGNQNEVLNLENGYCLMQDIYGRVATVYIHTVFDHLLDAFDTRPPYELAEG
jgi:hypothetical protein